MKRAVELVDRMANMGFQFRATRRKSRSGWVHSDPVKKWSRGGGVGRGPEWNTGGYQQQRGKKYTGEQSLKI